MLMEPCCMLSLALRWQASHKSKLAFLIHGLKTFRFDPIWVKWALLYIPDMTRRVFWLHSEGSVLRYGKSICGHPALQNTSNVCSEGHWKVSVGPLIATTHGFNYMWVLLSTWVFETDSPWQRCT